MDTRVSGPVNPAVAAGHDHSMALKSDGTVWTWGGNSRGELGRGTPLPQSTSGPVFSFQGVKVIAAAGSYSLALKQDGTVWGWGENRYGQMGDGTTERRLRPVQIKGLTGIKAISARQTANSALSTVGEVWAWGSGPSTEEIMSKTWRGPAPPSRVKDVANVVAFGSGSGLAVALKADGTVWSWDPPHGQSTKKYSRGSVSPLGMVHGLSDIRAVATGGHHAVALRRDGTLWAWGANNASQLGDGTNTSSDAPVQVVGLDNVRTVAAGYLHTVAVKQDGTVWTWGWNSHAQLGEELSMTDRNYPGQVKGLQDVVAVAAGYGHSLAIKRDGTVWAWGWNRRGQLGDGTQTDRPTPVEVRGLNLGESLVTKDSIP